jgi:hypothetical protein
VSWKGCGRKLSRLLRGIRRNPWVNLRDERTLRQTSGKSALTPRFEPDTSRVQINHYKGFVISDRNSLLRAGRPINRVSISDLGIRSSCFTQPLGRLWGLSFFVFNGYWGVCFHGIIAAAMCRWHSPPTDAEVKNVRSDISTEVCGSWRAKGNYLIPCFEYTTRNLTYEICLTYVLLRN